MWAALRSDLKEFVTTVSAEGTSTLSALDEKLSSIDNDDDSEEEEREVPSAAVLDGEVFGEGFENTGIISNAIDEVAHRRTLEETYTETLPETEEVKQFLQTLQLANEETTAEISYILQSHPDTVQHYFTDLVPTEVSYEDFWSRYFYRCDEERVEAQWEEERAERARARKAAAEALMNNAKQGWNIARHLVGDAAKALIGDTSSTIRTTEDSNTNNSSAKAIVHGGLHWGGRPPFVLQSNDESADDEEEGDDEEEELGWDDEEEEDLDEDDEDGEVEISQNTTVESEEIVFHREEAQAQYAATQEEMDQLHETIEMQRLEIESLKTKLESVGETKVVAESNADLEQLQLIIFEKDSELAALKSKLQDTDEDDHDAEGHVDPQTVPKGKYLDLKNQVENLEAALAKKDEEVLLVKEEMAQKSEAASKEASIENLELKSQIELLTENAASAFDQEATSALVSSLQSKLEEKDAAIFQAELKLKHIAECESTIVSLNEELDIVKASCEEALATVNSQQDLLHESNTSIIQLRDSLASSQTENQALRDEVSNMKIRIDELVDDLKRAQDFNREQEALFSKRLQEELEKGKGDSPESSFSSAVNVDSTLFYSPPPSLGSLPELSAPQAAQSKKPPTGASGEGQDEDDWGDGWGDEDDIDADKD